VLLKSSGDPVVTLGKPCVPAIVLQVIPAWHQERLLCLTEQKRQQLALARLDIIARLWRVAGLARVDARREGSVQMVMEHSMLTGGLAAAAIMMRSLGLLSDTHKLILRNRSVPLCSAAAINLYAYSKQMPLLMHVFSRLSPLSRQSPNYGTTAP